MYKCVSFEYNKVAYNGNSFSTQLASISVSIQ